MPAHPRLQRNRVIRQQATNRHAWAGSPDRRLPRRGDARGRLFSLAAALAVFASIAPLTAQTLDRIVLTNGNVLDGEVLGLRRGDLEFDTDAMDIVLIDWGDIASVTSAANFEVTDETGLQYYGTLSPGGTEGVLTVGTGPTAVSLPFAIVVEIRNLADGFFAKTDGFLDLGTNVSRANRLRSVLFKGHVGFNGLAWELDVDAESYFQSQTTTTTQAEEVDERTTRNSFALAGRRFFNAEVAATTSVEIEENEELDLDRRLLLSLGARYNFVRSPGMELHAGVSGVMNGERFAGEEATESAEISLSAGFDMFDVGDVDIYTQVDAFRTPSDGRYRVNVDARISWEIVDDFSIGLSMIERYDSSPGADASKRDFQYGFTVGWSWS